MATRDELVEALSRRYGMSGREEKTRILNEFVAVTGFHRKHAMRLLRGGATTRPAAASRPGRRLYDDAVREALVVLWEASDRICGKRLKPLLPTLVEAMEQHGHLDLAEDVRRFAEHERGDYRPGASRGTGTGRRTTPTETGGIVLGAAEHSGAHPFRLVRPAAGLRGGRSRGAQRPGHAGELRPDAGAHRYCLGMDGMRALAVPRADAGERGAHWSARTPAVRSSRLRHRQRQRVPERDGAGLLT